MSDCLHCDIHELLESHLQSEEVNLADVTAKVTEVLADFSFTRSSAERGTLMAAPSPTWAGLFYKKVKTGRASQIRVATSPAYLHEVEVGTSGSESGRSWPQTTTKMRRLCGLFALCASGFRASRDARLEFIDRHDVSG